MFVLSKFIFDTNWRVVGSLKVGGQAYSIARLDDKDGVHFIVGRLGLTGEDNLKPGVEEKPKFIGVLRIDLSTQAEIGDALGYANLHSVNSVGVKESQRGLGFAKLVYEWLVSDQGMTIIGDRTQYFGARRLWAALSKVVDSVVDIVDVKTQRILEKDVTLHHGVYDHDFDNRVWSYGQEMAHVRVVLKQVR